MNVSPNELRRETVKLMKAVNDEMTKIEEEAQQFSESPFQVRDSDGNRLYASLVSSKASLLNTLTLLQEPPKERRR